MQVPQLTQLLVLVAAPGVLRGCLHDNCDHTHSFTHSCVQHDKATPQVTQGWAIQDHALRNTCLFGIDHKNGDSPIHVLGYLSCRISATFVRTSITSTSLPGSKRPMNVLCQSCNGTEKDKGTGHSRWWHNINQTPKRARAGCVCKAGAPYLEGHGHEQGTALVAGVHHVANLHACTWLHCNRAGTDTWREGVAASVNALIPHGSVHK